MLKQFILVTASLVTVAFAADQLTIQKVTVNTTSGTITGKVVGTGDSLVFIDDANPDKSYTLNRGSV